MKVDREAVAALCHEQWSGWMKYLFGKCTAMGSGMLIPGWAVSRWQNQAATTYANFKDPEKDSDRKEADRFIALFADRNPDTYAESNGNTIQGLEKELAEVRDMKAASHLIGSQLLVAQSDNRHQAEEIQSLQGKLRDAEKIIEVGKPDNERQAKTIWELRAEVVAREKDRDELLGIHNTVRNILKASRPQNLIERAEAVMAELDKAHVHNRHYLENLCRLAAFLNLPKNATAPAVVSSVINQMIVVKARYEELVTERDQLKAELDADKDLRADDARLWAEAERSDLATARAENDKLKDKLAELKKSAEIDAGVIKTQDRIIGGTTLRCEQPGYDTPKGQSGTVGVLVAALKKVCDTAKATVVSFELLGEIEDICLVALAKAHDEDGAELSVEKGKATDKLNAPAPDAAASFDAGKRAGRKEVEARVKAALSAGQVGS